MLLDIQLINLNTPHSKGYVIDLPQGRSNSIFMQFTSKARILTAAGMEVIHPGECILTLSRTPAYIESLESDPEGFTNNYVIFQEDVVLQKAIRQYQVPHHTIIREADFAFVKGILTRLYMEHAQKPSMYKEQIDLLLRELLVCLSRAAARTDNPLCTTNRELVRAIQQVRMDMYLDLSQYPTVSSMAEKVNICTGYFRNVYKELFGVSPKQDILNARIEHSKSLLVLTDSPISLISVLCGFEDENYFSRAFRDRVHMTPSAYRKQFAIHENTSHLSSE